MQFRWKITLAMISLVSLLFCIGGTLLISSSFQDSLSQEIRSDLSSYQLILSSISVISQNANWETQEDLSSGFLSLMRESKKGTSATLSNNSGIQTSYGKEISFFEDLTKETSSTELGYRIISPREHPFWDYASTDYFLQVCGCLQINEETFFLNISYDLAPIYATRAGQQEIFLRIFLLLVAACAFFCFGMVLILTRPLMRLTRTAKRISSGDYTCRSPISSHDEIGLLSDSFNQMTDSLVSHMDELNAAMERQNAFVGNFTHELKTPMTSIIGYTDLLRSESLTGEDAREAANFIFSEGKRLEHLSIKLLELLVMQESDVSLQPARPHLLLDSLLPLIQKEYEQSGIALTYECETGICLLEPDYFISLTRNLLENARRAIVPNSGRIHLSLSMTEKGCVLSVKDDGRGIPKEALSHLTDAFYRVDKARSRSHGGAGLGLSLCMRIAKLHGGDIRFLSEPGAGTTVTVTLNGGLL